MRGLAETRAGLLLQHVPREAVIVATKIGFDISGEVTRRDYSRDGILRSLEGSLTRLNIDHVDIVHIHDPDDYYREALDCAFPTLETLRSAGVIKAIGAGMNQWQMLLKFAQNADFDCFMIAGRYTLLEQDALPLLEYCHGRSISIFAASIYNSGILATGTKQSSPLTYNHGAASKDIINRVQRFELICQAFEVSIHTLATQFPAAHPAVNSLIVGFQKPEEVRAYLEAVQQIVPSGVWEQLQREKLIVSGTYVSGRDTL